MFDAIAYDSLRPQPEFLLLRCFGLFWNVRTRGFMERKLNIYILQSTSMLVLYCLKV